MKTKILRIFLAIVVTLPMFTSVFAISYEDLFARLEQIVDDIEGMKQEYNLILETYPEVIASLSEETKAAVEALPDNLMSDGIEQTVKNLKAELAASEATDADKVLAAIEDLQADATELIDSNKDIVEEVKSGYSDLTVEEITQVVEKVTEIIESLGAEVDVTDTYNQMMTILDEAHDIAMDITVKFEEIVANNVETFESALSLDLVKELLRELQAKDEEAIIDTLIAAINSAKGGAELKSELKELKAIIIELKDKIMEMDTLSQQDLLMFSDEQKADVAAKVKEVEKDYVDFAKVIIDTYAEDYMDVVIDAAYNKTVDQMVKYANIALDYYAEYEDTLKSLSLSSIAAKLPQDLVEKAGLMVALGFVDISDYNLAYIKENFATQIDNVINYLAGKLVEYVDYIDLTINEEVDNVYENAGDSATVQNELRAITAARFNTLAEIKALKARVDEELLANHENIKAELTQVVNFVYNMYEENIFASIEGTLTKEAEDVAKKYEFDPTEAFVITNKFMPTTEFTAELGLPESESDRVSYLNTLSGKVKTGSTFEVDMNGLVGEAMFAVLGDIYADGLIDARDYMVIKNYIMDGEEVSDVSLLAADTYRDGLIDARDYMVIKNYIMDGMEISL